MIFHSVSMSSLAVRFLCDFLTIPPLYIESAWVSAVAVAAWFCSMCAVLQITENSFRQ